jgi:hypothetical protein
VFPTFERNNPLSVRLTLLLAFLFIGTLQAQFRFQLSNQVPVTVNGKILKGAWSGGLNNPQFSDIDFNSDGLEDLLVFDRDGQKVLPFMNTGVAGSPIYTYRPDYEKHFPPGHTFYQLVDYNNDGKPDVFTRGEPFIRTLRIFKNTSTGSIPTFEDQGLILRETVALPPVNWQIFTFDATDIPSFTDVDQDGDIDVVFYVNVYGGYSMCRNLQVEQSLPPDSFRFRYVDFCFGYFRESPFFNEVFLGNCVEPFKWRHAGGSSCLLWDMDEDKDHEMVIGNVGFQNLLWLKNGKSDTRNEWDTMDGQSSIFPIESRQAANYEFPAAFKADIDKDGISDLVVAPSAPGTSSEKNQVWYYRNKGKENLTNFEFKQDNLLQEDMIDLGGNTAPYFWDIDNDGDQDLLVVNNGNFSQTSNWRDRIALFRNTGSKTQAAFTLEDEDFLRFSTQGLSYMRIAMGDLNGDGRPDLLVGNMPGYVRYYYNNSTGGNLAFVLADTNLLDLAFVPRDRYYAAPELYDINKDGLLDMLLGGFDGKVQLWMNTGNSTTPSFTLYDEFFGEMRGNEFRWDFNPPQYGFDGYASPRVCDLNSDGRKEVIVGTVYGGLRVYELNLRQMPDSFAQYQSVFHAPGDVDGSEYDMGYLATAAAADLDGDGKQEIIGGNSRGGLYFFANNSVAMGLKLQAYVLPVNLYPNPANDAVQIRVAPFGAGMLTVSDALGRQVSQQTIKRGQENLNLQTAHWQPGVYFLTIDGNLASGNTRLLIQR